jgi:hypothetical protein
MTKKIDTLIADIYEILDNGAAYEDEEAFDKYGFNQRDILFSRLDPDTSHREPRLRLSSIGAPCSRQLWYGLHASDKREPFLPGTMLKFLFGDLTEALVLQLARATGHLVEGEQDEILVHGVKGHRDCIIDGVLVDVKSASPYSFIKFEGGLQREDDSFGYLTQLGSYLLGSRDDPLVKEKNKAAFLVFNKVTGKLCLDMHTFTEEDFANIIYTIALRKVIASNTRATPDRGFAPVDQNKPNKKGWVNGNLKLDTNCSYCDWKNTCWPELRTFLYKGGPVFLTHVEKEPEVPEATKNG